MPPVPRLPETAKGGAEAPPRLAEVPPLNGSFMMTISQASQPVPLADVAELLDRSAERDRYLARILAAARESWDRCWPIAADAGRQAEAAERDRLWAEIARPVARGGPSFAELEGRRWLALCGRCRRSSPQRGCDRCQSRTRATFGQPHPDDHEGGPVQPW